MKKDFNIDKEIKILFIEDNDFDIELSLSKLNENDFKIKYDKVFSEEQFNKQIDNNIYDIIIADYNLPKWTGYSAFKKIKLLNMNIPFILVTGALGEEKAVELIKDGITDYVLKNNLERLPIAVTRALKEKALENEKLKADKNLQESQDWNKQLINNMNEGICSLNKNWEITYTNENFLNMWETTEKVIIGQPIFNYLDDANKNQLNYLFRRRDKGRKEYSEIEWKINENKKLLSIVSVVLTNNTNNDKKRYFCIITDISKLKEREDEINKLNDKLEKQNLELRQTNKELIKQKEKAEDASKTKTEFLAVMSHELRTPLNGILGHTQILQLDLFDFEYKKHLDIILESGKHLLTIIDDILEISRIDSGKDQFKASLFQIQQIIESSLKMTNCYSKEKSFIINNEIPNIRIETDKAKLRQIFVNLLSNAHKFTTIGGTITLTMKDLKDKYEFMISDTGIGIPIENQKNIFELFYQVDYSSTRRYGGTGLGLTLCKRLVEKLGGDIWVESKPNQGSKFFFTIRKNISKYDDYSIDKSKNEKYETNNNKNSTVLIVDDEKISSSVIKSLLRKKGINCLTAENGKNAIDILNNSNEQINLILMDLQMPVMNGFEATKRIKHNTDFNMIPIIAVTAYARDEDRERCYNLGCDDFITKPFDIHDLFNRIKKWVDF